MNGGISVGSGNSGANVPGSMLKPFIGGGMGPQGLPKTGGGDPLQSISPPTPVPAGNPGPPKLLGKIAEEFAKMDPIIAKQKNSKMPARQQSLKMIKDELMKEFEKIDQILGSGEE